MHVLILSLDNGLFEGKDGFKKRLLKYAKKVSRLSVIVYTSKKYKPVKIAKNCMVYPSNSVSKMLFPQQALKMGVQIHQSHAVDLIDTQDSQGTGLAGVWLKKKLRLPLQVQLHGDYVANKWWMNSPQRKMLNKLALFVLKRADSIRVVSKRIEKNIIKAGISKSKITRYSIFTDVKKFEKGKTKVSKNPFFVFVGRLSEEKNIPLLLHAFANTLNTFPKAKLCIVGDGSAKKSLVKLTNKLNIQKAVSFVGFADPLPYYKKATALVLPSLHEGWALVVIEAAAAGCPVIMSDVGCAGEVIINRKSGIVFPVNNQKKLQEAMTVLASDNKLRNSLISGAKKKVSALPSEGEIINMLVSSWKKTAVKK